MSRLTTILIISLLVLLVFPIITNPTGQAQRSWKTTVKLCSDTDANLNNNEFISGYVRYYSRARLYKYIDTCSGSYIYEGTCIDNVLYKEKIYCKHGCDAAGPDNHGACICETNEECPAGYTCRYGTCGIYMKTIEEH